MESRVTGFDTSLYQSNIGTSKQRESLPQERTANQGFKGMTGFKLKKKLDSPVRKTVHFVRNGMPNERDKYEEFGDYLNYYNMDIRTALHNIRGRS